MRADHGGKVVSRSDAETLETIERVRRDGVCFVGGARWRGRWGMRFSICSWWTQEADIDAALDSILDAWRAVRRLATGAATAAQSSPAD